MFYPPNQLDAVKDALLKYQNNTDVKASAAVVLNYASGQVRPIPSVYSNRISLTLNS